MRTWLDGLGLEEQAEAASAMGIDLAADFDRGRSVVPLPPPLAGVALSYIPPVGYEEAKKTKSKKVQSGARARRSSLSLAMVVQDVSDRSNRSVDEGARLLCLQGHRPSP